MTKQLFYHCDESTYCNTIEQPLISFLSYLTSRVNRPVLYSSVYPVDCPESWTSLLPVSSYRDFCLEALSCILNEQDGP